MLIRRKVAVKVIVTESFQHEFIERLRQALEKVDLSQQELESQGLGYLSELEGKDPGQAEAFRRRLGRQQRRQQQIKAKLAEQLATAEKLEIGTEYHQGTLEGLVEISPGDMLQEKIHGAEIVIKDGCVVETRND